MFWIVAILVAAAVVGFFGQQRLLARRGRRHPDADVEGLPAAELVIPVRTLAALLLAFVLLSSYTSYQDAQDAAASEAGAVLAMAEDAVVLSDTARTDVIGTLSCYARSVIGPDWAAQAASSDGRGSPITDAASNRITEALDRARTSTADQVAAGAVLADDSTRIQARISRLDESRPSVPTELWALLIVSVAIMIAGLGALGHPAVRTRIQVGILVGTTVVFGLTLLVIHDLDRPFSGPAKIEPSAMRDVERRIATLPGSTATPPCDRDGRPAAS